MLTCHIWWTLTVRSTHKIGCISLVRWIHSVVVHCTMCDFFLLNQNKPWVTSINCVTSPMHMHISYHISDVSQFTSNHICLGPCIQSTSLQKSLVSTSHSHACVIIVTLCDMDSPWSAEWSSVCEWEDYKCHIKCHECRIMCHKCHIMWHRCHLMKHCLVSGSCLRVRGLSPTYVSATVIPFILLQQVNIALAFQE